MRCHTPTAALAAILLIPLFAAAPAGRHALQTPQVAPSYTYRGTVHAVNPRTGSLDLITGIGMSLRLVHMIAPPAAHFASAGSVRRLADLKPGDVVRAECRRTAGGLVADRIEKVEVHEP
jgi:hypothetical protein